ncbi:hypothetical protein [Paractinoplanes hotanensis]|uniref:Uncharacterized protein n=1 Tax=Paractinoplanes hotanensis TaxID=2906497 RepID=A0ABT0Y2K3_9ACTN|nr:hypothetical protein [Actinoplanes hotanensis]MCM4080272.1 hypothetical protein [Actinoplanes hotanensis]
MTEQNSFGSTRAAIEDALGLRGSEALIGPIGRLCGWSRMLVGEGRALWST